MLKLFLGMFLPNNVLGSNRRSNSGSSTVVLYRAN